MHETLCCITVCVTGTNKSADTNIYTRLTKCIMPWFSIICFSRFYNGLHLSSLVYRTIKAVTDVHQEQFESHSPSQGHFDKASGDSKQEHHAPSYIQLWVCVMEIVCACVLFMHHSVLAPRSVVVETELRCLVFTFLSFDHFIRINSWQVVLF